MGWLVGTALAALAAALALAARPTARRAGVVAAALIAATGVAAALRLPRVAEERASRAALVAAVPELGRPAAGYVSSDACRSCHPAEHASWHRSFHRTMTTLATPETVLAPFDGRTLENRGRDYRLSRRGDQYRVELVDPDWERNERLAGRDPDAHPSPPRVERRVVMVTGSHHMQTFWVEGRHGNEVYNLPFVWLLEGPRWAPREEVFLRPPGAERFFAVWNNSCVECHSTGARVGFETATEQFRSSVAELGIACEACHGPGAAHVAANRDPLRRWALRRSAESDDPTIVQPARLDPRAASQVCGQCHGVSLPHDELEWLTEGHAFRPGEEIEATRWLVRPADPALAPELARLEARAPGAIASRFWPDGEVRVSGREYSAMIESACFERGALGCLSCHSMHDAPPADQLKAGADGDAACLSCHDAGRFATAGHTRHAAASEGSRCQNCHMPYTTYGLLKAIRSHRIASPSAAVTLATGRPNACNLCHLDRTLGWTAEQLERWYGQPAPALARERATVSAALLDLLAGEAGQRALAAWSFGWAPAQEASGTGWMAPYLAHLLEDPYATVRYVAGRSLATLPGHRGFAYDFVSPAAARSAARRAALDLWFDAPLAWLDRNGEAVLVDGAGNPMDARIAALVARRDDRPVVLAE